VRERGTTILPGYAFAPDTEPHEGPERELRQQRFSVESHPRRRECRSSFPGQAKEAGH